MKPAPLIYSFGCIQFHPAQQELRGGAERVTLPVTLNKLLLLLVTRAGDLVTRDEIAEALWEDHGTIDIENGINGVVRRLRGQLAASGTTGSAGGEVVGTAANAIETVVGSGYRFVMPVTVEGWVERRAVSRNVAEPAVEPVVGAKPGTASWWDWRQMVALAAGVAVVLCALAYVGWRRFLAADRAGAAPQAMVVDWSPVTFDEVEDGLTAQALSPSGRLVAFADRSGIGLRPAHGGVLLSLQAPAGLAVERLAWSPDESGVVASGTREGHAEVWTVSALGSTPVRLLDDGSRAVVSPDGKRLAFLRAGATEVWVAAADGRGVRRLLAAVKDTRVSCLLWAPGSDRVVLDRESSAAQGSMGAEQGALSQLELQHRFTYESYDAAGGALLARGADLRFESGALTADGRFIYPALDETRTLKLMIARTDRKTGSLTSRPSATNMGKLGMDAFNAASLDISGDGKVTSAILERPSVDVYIGRLRYAAGMPALEGIERLTHHAGTSLPTAWSPQGDAVVYDEGDAGLSIIAEQRLAGGAREVLVNPGGRAVQGQFTPDGKWILFLRYAGEPARVQSVERVTPEGGRPEVVYASENILDFRCSRSDRGRCLVRETVGDKALAFHELTAAGRGAEVVRTAWTPHALGDWSLSADGTMLATATHDPMAPGVTLLKIGSTAPAGMLAVEGFGTVLGSTWAVDGKGLFVQTHSEDGYALVYVAREGRAKVVVKSPDAIWAVPSRDGTKLAFPGRTALNRNVWVGKVR